MFSQTTNTETEGAWMNQSHEMLLANQEVLDYDYSSFSDDSSSPILSLQSFSQQHSPELGSYCFSDLEPLIPSSSSSNLTLPPVLTAIGNPLVPKPSASETARQAAVLHAYLTAQNQAFAQIQQLQQQQQQQQRWDSSLSQMKNMEQQQVAESTSEEKNVQLDKTQKTDAEILARYLAEIRQVKEEAPQEKNDSDMESAEAESIHAPSSPSSSTSSVMPERSPSPEDSHESLHSKNQNSKLSRQLTCYNCNVTQTPLWRRTPDRQHSLCNACGLYYKQYGAHRPLNVRHKLPSVLGDPRGNSMPYSRPSHTRGSSPSGPESSDSDSDSSQEHGNNFHSLPDLTKMYTDALLRPTAQKINPPLMIAKQGIECANCSQTQTPLWRKNEAGEPICNACGLYAKLHNRARPVTMRKTKITRRRRDWGGNLAHQAHAQAQALAQIHAQVQAQVEAQVKVGEVDTNSSEVSVEASMVHEMSCKAQELNGRSNMSSSANSSDSEEEQKPAQALHSQQQSSNVAQKLTGNLIMDEQKFSEMVCQMNAHQMNRFLSILENRCGVLRNRIISSTEGSDSSLDGLF
ncbi:hypothetical protein BGZ76_008267 [Entomortierella beljakovae]|nr:hypothetical protein BGZ76_008267 [Entomortierella beljakovae]